MSPRQVKIIEAEALNPGQMLGVMVETSQSCSLISMVLYTPSITNAVMKTHYHTTVHSRAIAWNALYMAVVSVSKPVSLWKNRQPNLYEPTRLVEIWMEFILLCMTINGMLIINIVCCISQNGSDSTHGRFITTIPFD